MSHENETCACCERNTERSGWGSGPWDGEPNRLEFEHAGLPCILHRGGGGAWCGYVGLAPSHPLHGKSYHECDGVDSLDVHGGITYAEECGGCVCHIPKPGEPENLWWLGFDCAHYLDMRPRDALSDFYEIRGHYWTAEECTEETKRLAEQLAVMATTDPRTGER